MHAVETGLRVRYAETDRMGIVYHAHYLVWFEIGRTEYCREAGFPYRAMEEAGLFILVTEVACRYRSPTRYDDAVRVRTTMPELASRGLTFAYEILGSDGRTLAEGSTRHVFADPEGRLRRAPAELLEALHRFREREVGKA